jgi:hypothetical protein
VNHRLVICLGLSVLAGGAASACALAAGLGWVAAFAAYSVGGSVSLVGFAAAACLLETAAPMRAKVEPRVGARTYA